MGIKNIDDIHAAKAENRAIWKEREEKILLLDEGMTPRQFKDPTFIELRGVGCVTHPEFLRQGMIMGSKIGMYEVKNPCSHIEVRNDADLKMASRLIPEWFGSGRGGVRGATKRRKRSTLARR